jgi:hypothetical protein
LAFPFLESNVLSFDDEEMAIGSELNILLAERKILVKLTLTTEKQQITYL